jgi:hypothetical protein
VAADASALPAAVPEHYFQLRILPFNVSLATLPGVCEN